MLSTPTPRVKLELLPLRAQRLWEALSHHDRGTRIVWPGRSRLAMLLRVTRRTVSRAIRDLVDAGYIIIRRTGRASRYLLACVPSLSHRARAIPKRLEDPEKREKPKAMARPSQNEIPPEALRDPAKLEAIVADWRTRGVVPEFRGTPFDVLALAQRALRTARNPVGFLIGVLKRGTALWHRIEDEDRAREILRRRELPARACVREPDPVPVAPPASADCKAWIAAYTVAQRANRGENARLIARHLLRDRGWSDARTLAAENEAGEV